MSKTTYSLTTVLTSPYTNNLANARACRTKQTRLTLYPTDPHVITSLHHENIAYLHVFNDRLNPCVNSNSRVGEKKGGEGHTVTLIPPKFQNSCNIPPSYGVNLKLPPRFFFYIYIFRDFPHEVYFLRSHLCGVLLLFVSCVYLLYPWTCRSLPRPTMNPQRKGEGWEFFPVNPFDLEFASSAPTHCKIK